VGDFKSAFSDICWPAMIGGRKASLLALVLQLEQSQWWTPERIAEEQQRQLALVLSHAQQTVPYYHQRFGAWGADLSHCEVGQRWSQLPLLSRREVQMAGESLRSTRIPKSHGNVTTSTTSGSTGQPVTTWGTEVTDFFWHAITLRDHFWHRRDFRQSLAAIRHTGDNKALAPLGIRMNDWGGAVTGVLSTGPGYLLNIRSSVDEQLAWLKRIQPNYLLTYPSVLIEIARQIQLRGESLPRMQGLRTFGEVLDSECRAVCQNSFGVEIVDMYSSQEVGYLALQCPETEQYHVMAENVLVEVLDDHNDPCRPGEVGRVVVSTLHNFASPLLRYDIGDFAEVGEPCSCGRGLPTLRRILGRQRNLLVLPGGTRRWPVFDAHRQPADMPPVFQYQVIQRSEAKIEVHVVRHADFTSSEEEIVRRYVTQMLEHSFDIHICRVDSIARSPSGKFEDFISLVDVG
jgi:phenylacetate-CoA ligase